MPERSPNDALRARAAPDADLSAAAGRVVGVRGSVIDVAFAPGGLPQVGEAIEILWDGAGRLVAEVHSHLDATTARAVAMQQTAGLRRGVAVRATGAPITMPVGEAVLGRLLNAMGEPEIGRAHV